MDTGLSNKQENKLRKETYQYLAAKKNLPTGNQWRPSKDMDIRRKPKKEFNFVGKSNNKVVRIREDFIIVRGNKKKVYRNEKGMFSKFVG